MLSKKYRLSYLLLFYDELDEKVTYIVEKLKIMEVRRFIYNGQNRESLL